MAALQPAKLLMPFPPSGAPQKSNGPRPLPHNGRALKCTDAPPSLRSPGKYFDGQASQGVYHPFNVRNQASSSFY